MFALSVHSLCPLLAAVDVQGTLRSTWFYLLILLGFSFIIFFHELGHFLAAKWAGVRVEQFAVGFFREIFGFTRGETRYSFNLLPLGGYVKMLGQEDFEINPEGELAVRADPRSFANKPVGRRMVIVSAGVIMNLLLAAALFMIVFMIGMRVPEPRIGGVLPEGPAALAGILPGDIIRRVDGREINDHHEISMAVVLSEPGKPLDFEIERDGQIKHLCLLPERDPARGIFQIGMLSAHSAEIAVAGPSYHLGEPRHPRAGDKVVSIDGQEVTDANANTLLNVLFSNPLDVTEVTVERRLNADVPDSETSRVPVELNPRLILQPAEVNDKPPHLLGLVPLLRVSAVEEGSRADYAGLEVGDVILEWDGLANPSPKQVEQGILKCDPERDVPVRVRRASNGHDETVVVRPKVKVMPLTRKRSRPYLGADLHMFADDWLRVAAIVDDVAGEPTPAKLSGLPVNAVITRVNDQPVKRWIELAEALRAQAGSDVTLTYDLGKKRNETCTFHVPHCVHTMLGLAPGSVIVSVADAESAEVAVRGRTAQVTVAHPLGLRAALTKHVGETVEVKYRRDRLAEMQVGQVEVTQDMVEPWVGLMGYDSDIGLGGRYIMLRKTNPIQAVMVGVHKTHYFVVQVYQTMQRMIFSRSLSPENIQGPVGILKLGRQTAERGLVDLLFFLAIISANLAVINFLPLPIVDGGLMVFLIIEKIKGSPISIRVQVATQVIGLIMIVSAFLYVTLQDIYR